MAATIRVLPHSLCGMQHLADSAATEAVGCCSGKRSRSRSIPDQNWGRFWDALRDGSATGSDHLPCEGCDFRAIDARNKMLDELSETGPQEQPVSRGAP